MIVNYLFILKYLCYDCVHFNSAEEASEADGKQVKDGDGRPGKFILIFIIFKHYIYIHIYNACKIMGICNVKKIFGGA